MTSPNPPSNFPPCEDCGGAQVGNLVLWGQVGLHLPGQTVWIEPMSRLRAVVCLSCGRVKFFAGNLNAIRQETQAHPEKFAW